MSKFDKNAAEHEIVMAKLNNNFALKMASMITTAVLIGIISICVFAGAVTSTALIIVGIAALFFAVIVFNSVRGMCLA